ncbi:MAG: hypothetical protein HDT28_02775 [Clostridiales bacterium]|nr:hypothetical protein [Clostridiales bacterium]
MAKNKTGEKKKKQGIVSRMMFGNDNKPDLTPERMQTSKWGMFRYLFFSRFGTMVLLNILTALFALPAVAVFVIFYLNKAVAAGYVPYSSNIGIGYPVVIDAAQIGAEIAFSFQMMEYLILVPCIAIFFLGLAGNFYVIRKLIWEEATRTFKDFFRGIKKCWLGAITMGFAVGLTILLVVFSFGYFDTYNLSNAVKVLSIVLSIILLVFMILFASFFMTQNAAFKMRPLVLIRNSVLFIVGTNILGIFFIGLALAPAYLAFIPGITMLLVMIYFFLGFSFSTLVISLFTHYCYEQYLYDKIEDKPSTIYVKRQSDVDDAAAEKAAKQRKSPAPYKNPKKRKRSIDEGSSITPLTPTFRREDLERLEKEHEKVMSESVAGDDEAAEEVSAANVNTQAAGNAVQTETNTEKE